MRLVVLAPMAGFTHSPFRRLIRELGADWTWSELISSRMLLTKGLEDPLLNFVPNERPIRIQIHGADPEDVFKAAEQILKHLRPDGLDLNAGCPAPKVIKTGAGAALLANLDRLYHVALALAEACKPYGILPSVKFRLGFKQDELERIAEVLLKAGIKILVLHARLAKEGYATKARWARIGRLKQMVGKDALVIGNGDVKNLTDIYQMFQDTGCDGVMIGRAALSRPWIFREYRLGRSIDFSVKDRICLLTSLWEHLRAERGPERAFKVLKLFVPKILKGVRGRKQLVSCLLQVKEPVLFWQQLKFYHENRSP